MGIFSQTELPGIFTPPDEAGHPPSSLATPWSDSGCANTDSSQRPRSTELPTHSKTGWWEKGKAPLSLPCALRGAADASARWGRLGQPRTPCTGMDRDKGIRCGSCCPVWGKWTGSCPPGLVKEGGFEELRKRIRKCRVGVWAAAKGGGTCKVSSAAQILDFIRT